MANMKLLFVITVISCWISTFAQDVVYYIDEELPNSTFIGNVMNDSNLFSAIGGADSATLIFSTTDNEYAHYFRVNERTSDLYTNGNIDREVICEFSESCMLNIQIFAKSTLGSFFHILKINIFVKDINDHSPVFSNPTLRMTISESVVVGTSFAINGARDRDTSTDFSLKHYYLESGMESGNLPFSIQFVKHLDGSSTVRLFVTEALDREIQDSYIFEIIAADGDQPSRKGKLLVTVEVSDVNDNTPTFNTTSYNCTVSEETEINSVIIKLNATDPDFEENGLVKYRFSTHQSADIFTHFQISENTGDIILKQKVVYSPGKMYNIIVEAFDNPANGQSLSTQTLVRVIVENSGNNAPLIKVSKTSNEVAENANIGKVVAYVEVQDHDFGKEGMASCIIQAIDFDMQRIDMNRYKVFVSQQLDYERTRSQEVTIHCQDNGDRPLSASTTFVINILDFNDHSPIFSEDFYTANVREDTTQGRLIFEVSASDADTGNNSLIDFLVEKKFQHLFYFEKSAIKENAAYLKLGGPLDREINSSFVFSIYAKDNGETRKTGTATVSLTITDVNDERPNFTKTPFEFYVPENLPPNSDVNRITAIDNDLGINAQVEFKMHPDYIGKVPFVVFADGKIKTNHDLDREQRDRYEFKVIGTDRGEPSLSNTGNVIVRVTDANDNVPIIKFPKLGNNTLFLSQSVKAWQIISRVNASDIDEVGSGNSRLTFSIEGRNDSNLFQINPNTGEIQVTGTLLGSDIGKIFMLELYVTDNGKPTKLGAETVLYIKVRSENATNAAASTDILSNKNILIAVIVSVVTVVVSFGIVAVICVIRKIDRERKLEQQIKNNNQMTVDPDINSKQVFDGSITVFSLPSEDSLLEKKKKEVSFSLEDDVFSDDDLIQKNGIDHNHRHFKMLSLWMSLKLAEQLNVFNVGMELQSSTCGSHILGNLMFFSTTGFYRKIAQSIKHIKRRTCYKKSENGIKGTLMRRYFDDMHPQGGLLHKSFQIFPQIKPSNYTACSSVGQERFGIK
ncbi:PC11Y-like protein [Mya arenaria]|uniref:PC11Y-like protein n=1 Tax=Mya arenaria TaxID=6604 RepID=A0ABY7DMZ6_MYAAR|nr:PC11Y-like protein [Mya arenaria]